MINKLLYGLKLYAALSLFFIVSVTILVILFGGVLGMPTKHGFFETIRLLWVNYFFNGYFLGIVAWRWQLLLLILTTITSLSERD
jgi:hypothetical protein